mgnify:CR=1 FL=1
MPIVKIKNNPELLRNLPVACGVYFFKNLINKLIARLSRAVKNEDYEEAVLLTSQINLLKNIRLNIPGNNYEKSDPDNVQIVGRLSKLLAEKGLNIKTLKKIECYDVSNTSGTNSTASMVVNINGAMSKKDYKKFKIKTVSGQNDYEMLKEVLLRRLKHHEWDFPDLIMVDGGFGQLSQFTKILTDLNLTNIPCISLAKREEIICLPGNSTVKLEYHDARLKLLQKIRDESHRFAKKYHILLRSREMLNK